MLTWCKISNSTSRKLNLGSNGWNGKIEGWVLFDMKQNTGPLYQRWPPGVALDSAAPTEPINRSVVTPQAFRFFFLTTIQLNVYSSKV